ncbi:MAG: hypothetical protein CMJ75_19185 [Planctomycetaceae bacterium]|nr:hypothetical protein [Planctomycetaceae bacterium]
MIKEIRRVTLNTPPDRDAWAFPDIWLFALRLDLPIGSRYPVYIKHLNKDFMSEETEKFGDVAALRSVTLIAPGGYILVHNDALPEPTPWQGSLKPVCNGVFIAATTHFEARIPSEMLCMSPPLNWKNFEDKDLRREFVPAGETIRFGKDDLGFGVVWGANQMKGFGVEPGDELTVDEDTVLAVVSRKAVPA